MKCTEKSCLFPANGKDGLCGYHRAMFSEEEESADTLLAEALPRRGSGRHHGIDLERPEIAASILTRDLSLRKGSLIPYDEYREQVQFIRTIRRVRDLNKYRRKIEAGICVSCLKTAVAGRIYCESHLIKARTKILALHHRRKAAGLCVACGRRPAKRSLFCEECYPKHRRSVNSSKQRIYARRIKLGLCRDCARPRGNSKSKIQCDECLSVRRENYDAVKTSLYSKKRFDRLKKLGLCTKCKRPVANFGDARCTKCRKKENSRYGRLQREARRLERIRRRNRGK